MDSTKHIFALSMVASLCIVSIISGRIHAQNGSAEKAGTGTAPVYSSSSDSIQADDSVQAPIDSSIRRNPNLAGSQPDAGEGSQSGLRTTWLAHMKRHFKVVVVLAALVAVGIGFLARWVRKGPRREETMGETVEEGLSTQERENVRHVLFRRLFQRRVEKEVDRSVNSSTSGAADDSVSVTKDLDTATLPLREELRDVQSRLEKCENGLAEILKSVQAIRGNTAEMDIRIGDRFSRDEHSIERLQNNVTAASLFDSFREQYQSECRETVKRLFESYSPTETVSEQMRTEYADKKEKLNKIWRALGEISHQLDKTPFSGKQEARADREEFTRRMNSFENRLNEIASVAFELRPPERLQAPSFMTFEEYLRSSLHGQRKTNGGYLGYLIAQYANHMDEALGEIKRQIDTMRSAGAQAADGLLDFMRQDLLNIVDTLDSFVEKVTGSNRHQLVEGHLVPLYHALNVSEIKAVIGEPYNAQFHEPKFMMPSDYPRDAVVKVNQRGFIDGNRKIVRKAAVSIAR